MVNTVVSRTLSIYGVFSSNIVVNWSRLWTIPRMTPHKSFKDFKLQSCPVFSNHHSFAPVIHDVTWWLLIMLKAWFIIRKNKTKKQLFLNNIGTAKNAVLIKEVINVTTGVSGASGSVGLISFKMVKNKQNKQKKRSETQEWLFSEIKAIQELALTGWERKKLVMSQMNIFKKHFETRKHRWSRRRLAQISPSLHFSAELTWSIS